MPYGSPYKVVGGTVTVVQGSQGHPIFITSGSVRKAAMRIDEITGPGDEGVPKFCAGNYAHFFRVRGHHASGVEATGVTYTHATKTLSSSGSFASVTVGDRLYISGGTNATAGLYVIATKADDDTVTLTTAPGVDNQTDFAISGGPTLGDIVEGPTTLQLGNGQQVTGSGLMEALSASAQWTGGGGIMPVELRGRFTGAVTWSRP